MTEVPLPITGHSDTPACKSPRERLILLRVETSPCTLVLDRILFYVNKAAMQPTDMAIEYGSKWQTIEISLDRDIFQPSEVFLMHLEALPAVKLAEFCDWRGRPLLSAQESAAGERIGQPGEWNAGVGDGTGHAPEPPPHR